MNNSGPEVMQVAGAADELACRTGMSRSSSSSGAKIPAEPVLPVEAATGIAREGLRPDFYGVPLAEIDSIDAARAQEYGLLAVLLARAPDAALLRRLAMIRGDSTPLGDAHA